MLSVTLFTTKKCCMLHFLQRKNVVRYTFYNEKMLNVTLFTAKKRDGVRIILDWHTATKNHCQRLV